MTGEHILYNTPIFPLNTVLFPGMPLPLQIFEERYLQMVRDLRAGDNRFCVALIREGQEVGGDAEPYDVACLAEMVHLQPLQGERYFMVAVGVERVRILSTDRLAAPYLTGSLELWPDRGGAVALELMQEASRLFLDYARCIIELSGETQEAVPMPAEADLLSYVLASGLQIDPRVRQDLLEMPGSEGRLRAELEILRSELPMLRLLAARPQPPGAGFGQFSAN